MAAEPEGKTQRGLNEERSGEKKNEKARVEERTLSEPASQAATMTREVAAAKCAKGKSTNERKDQSYSLRLWHGAARFASASAARLLQGSATLRPLQHTPQMDQPVKAGCW